MTNFKALNQKRKSDYLKNDADEQFMQSMNEVLQKQELELLQDRPIAYPFIFVFGLPRSGTTLTSQVLAYSLDVGYINNLMARFWLAPLHGIRLSLSSLGRERPTRFESDYARTKDPKDIHEFGYFWRHWLKKETFADITQAKKREEEIDWPGLRLTLSSMQHEFNQPMVFKNILGSYHLPRLQKELGPVLYIHIQRDPLDAAVSILQARKKYYSDLNAWWSYVPPEYDLLKDLDYWEQIAGQVYYLERFYAEEGDKLPAEHLIRVSYADLCRNPSDFLARVQQRCSDNYGQNIEIVSPPPRQFPYRTHDEFSQEKDRFKKLLGRLEQGE